LLLILFGGDPAAHRGLFSWQIPDVAAGPPGVPSGAASLRPLSSLELQDLVSFAGVLVAGRTLSQVEAGYLVDHMQNRMMREPDSLSLYQRAVTLLNRLAGARFSSLGIDQQTALVAR